MSVIFENVFGEVKKLLAHIYPKFGEQASTLDINKVTNFTSELWGDSNKLLLNLWSETLQIC